MEAMARVLADEIVEMLADKEDITFYFLFLFLIVISYEHNFEKNHNKKGCSTSCGVRVEYGYARCSRMVEDKSQGIQNSTKQTNK